jgi:hypothetical protein
MASVSKKDFLKSAHAIKKFKNFHLNPEVDSFGQCMTVEEFLKIAREHIL